MTIAFVSRFLLKRDRSFQIYLTNFPSSLSLSLSVWPQPSSKLWINSKSFLISLEIFVIFVFRIRIVANKIFDYRILIIDNQLLVIIRFESPDKSMNIINLGIF